MQLREEGGPWPLVTVDDGFTIGELSAMVVAGELIRLVGDVCRSPADADTPALRAAALTYLLPAALVPRAVLSHLTAAWVYGCGAAPHLLELSVSPERRTGKVPPGCGCVVHEVRLPAADVRRLGGGRLTTPQRTGVDVARRYPAVLAAPVLRALTADPTLDCPLSSLQQALEAGAHGAGVRAARRLLAGLAELPRTVPPARTVAPGPPARPDPAGSPAGAALRPGPGGDERRRDA